MPHLPVLKVLSDAEDERLNLSVSHSDRVQRWRSPPGWGYRSFLPGVGILIAAIANEVRLIRPDGVRKGERTCRSMRSIRLKKRPRLFTFRGPNGMCGIVTLSLSSRIARALSGLFDILAAPSLRCRAILDANTEKICT